MRMRYWAHSKIVEWARNKIGFPPRPTSATSRGWRDYERACKNHSKILDYMTDEMIDSIQDFVDWPADKLSSVAYWFHNRFIDPCWMTDTGLSKNTWHETDEIILHGMFSELVKYVECQKAWMNSDYPGNRSRVPYFIRKLSKYRNWQAGVDYLIWETKLKVDDSWVADKSDPRFGQPTPQAEAAVEKLELYCWWKYIRPNRLDPMNASGYTAYFDKCRELEGPDNSSWCGLDHENEPESLREEGQAASIKCSEIEKEYEREDEEMMIRLIKVRRSLWT